MAIPVNFKVKTFRTLSGYTAEIYHGAKKLGAVSGAPTVGEMFAMVGRYLEQSDHPDVADIRGRVERRY